MGRDRPRRQRQASRNPPRFPPVFPSPASLSSLRAAQKQKIAEGVRRHWEQVDREELAFQERKAKTCSLCGEPGHQALYCPNASPEMQELLAEQQRRKAEKISRANKGAPRRKKTAEERAKISRAMKERYKDGRVRRVCKICGQPGHYAKTCPHREGAAGAGAGAEAGGEGGA